MAQWVTTHYFDNYVADWGTITGNPIIKPIRVAIPQGMTAAQIQGLIVIAGGVAKPNQNAPCPTGAFDFTPRSLTFVMQNGSSVSIPVATNGDILNTATVGRGVFSNVVCIKLNGEEWNGLETIFNPGAAPTAGVYITPQAGKVKTIYSQTMDYASDMGNRTPLPVKIDSDSDTTPPAVFSSAWTDCVGANLGGAACRRVSGRKHRRFIVDRLVTLPNGNPGRQSSEVPTKERIPTDVRSCGTALAQITSTLCLNYRGESYPSVQLFI